MQFSPPGSRHSGRWEGRAVGDWTNSPGQSVPLPRFEIDGRVAGPAVQHPHRWPDRLPNGQWQGGWHSRGR